MIAARWPRWTSSTGWSWFFSAADADGLDRAVALVPVEFVADLRAAGRDRAGDDRAVPLHDEGAVDRQAEPLGRLAARDLPQPTFAMLGLQLVDAQPGVRPTSATIGASARNESLHQFADFQSRRPRASSRPRGRPWSAR